MERNENSRNADVSSLLAPRYFWLLFIQMAIVVPLVAGLIRPLVTLPFIQQASGRQQAFLLGAASGVGFAIIENIFYTGLGLNIWGGVVIVQALGGAVHPLGAGLVARGWYDIFCAAEVEDSAGLLPWQWTDTQRTGWLRHYAAAVIPYALWNGGSFLLFALAESDFISPALATADLSDLALFGLLLVVLVILGGGAWFALWQIGQEYPFIRPEKTDAIAPDQAVALWAVCCLLLVLPLGLAALRVLGGGP